MTDLATRQGLPDALRILLADYPREGWQTHRHFDGLVRFWLDRHLNFRHMTALMQTETQALLDRSRDPRDFAARLGQIGSHFVGDLHGHHQIEDQHYFPLLAETEPRLQRGFDMLDADHHALDSHIAAFVDSANATLSRWQAPDLRDHAASFLASLDGLTALLDRHLVDEEDLIVPVILAHGPGRLG